MTQSVDKFEDGHQTDIIENFSASLDQVQEKCIELATKSDILSSSTVEIEDPPDQDSPKHILNILNDDCLQEIFRRLKQMRDFLSAAKVCTRFQENAIECFPSTFKSLRIDDANDAPTSLPLEYLSDFLSIFGHFIQKIEWSWTQDREHDDDILNQIAAHCGKTLTAV